MVSLVAQPTTTLAILLQCQASKCVSSNRALCLASSQSTSSIGGSSSEDDSLDSLRGWSSLGLLGTAFTRQTGFSPQGQTLDTSPSSVVWEWTE